MSRECRRHSVLNRRWLRRADGAMLGFMGYFEEIQRVVRKIPRGRVATYGSVASAAGYPGTARQIAWALRAPGAARLPWHRVLGSAGKILLPGEAGLHQRTLLELEGITFRRNRADMNRHEFHFNRTL
jgi:methylated-DNA-protein-cysteine methyltransferase related protein